MDNKALRDRARQKSTVAQRLLKGALTPERDALTALLLDGIDRDIEVLDWKRTNAGDIARQKLRQIEVEQRADVLHYLCTGEAKGWAGDQLANGSVLLPPGFHGEVIDAAAQAWPMRRLCRNLTITTASIAIPSRRTLLSDAEWTTILGPVAFDTTEPYAMVPAEPQFLQKRLKVSRQLLRHGGRLAEEEIVGAINDAMARPIEAAALNGNDGLKPMGLLHTPGLPSYTTAASGVLTIADVKRWIGRLAGRWHASATALMHTDSYSALLELDVAGALVQNGQLLGRYPIELSDEFPSAGTNPASLTAGTTIAVLGDFSNFWFVDSLSEVQRLDELYAETSEVGFIGRAEVDAICTRPQAFNALVIKP